MNQFCFRKMEAFVLVAPCCMCTKMSAVVWKLHYYPHWDDVLKTSPHQLQHQHWGEINDPQVFQKFCRMQYESLSRFLVSYFVGKTRIVKGVVEEWRSGKFRDTKSESVRMSGRPENTTKCINLCHLEHNASKVNRSSVGTSAPLCLTN